MFLLRWQGRTSGPPWHWGVSGHTRYARIYFIFYFHCIHTNIGYSTLSVKQRATCGVCVHTVHYYSIFVQVHPLTNSLFSSPDTWGVGGLEEGDADGEGEVTRVGKQEIVFSPSRRFVFVFFLNIVTEYRFRLHFQSLDIRQWHSSPLAVIPTGGLDFAMVITCGKLRPPSRKIKSKFRNLTLTLVANRMHLCVAIRHDS